MEFRSFKVKIPVDTIQAASARGHTEEEAGLAAETLVNQAVQAAVEKLEYGQGD